MCSISAHITNMSSLVTKSRRSDRLVARISPEDKSLLMRAATLEGSTLASFVVSHVREAAQNVVRSHERIVLNEKESRRFVETLLAPPTPPTARFLEAHKLYRETVTEQ